MDETNCNSPYSLTETFYDCMSEWCCENGVQYENDTVTSYTLGLTEENFENQIELCGETLRILNYNPNLY